MIKLLKAPKKGGKIHGYVNLSKTPYKIVINKNQPKGRAKLAMVHEQVHIAAKEMKIRLTERQTHQMARYILRDLIPSLETFEEKWKEAKGDKDEYEYF